MINQLTYPGVYHKGNLFPHSFNQFCICLSIARARLQFGTEGHRNLIQKDEKIPRWRHLSAELPWAGSSWTIGPVRFAKTKDRDRPS